MSDEKKKNYNRKNVNAIKRFILVAFVVMFAIPVLLCVFLMVRMSQLDRKLDELAMKLEDGQSVASDSELRKDTNLKDLDEQAYENIEKNTTEEHGYLSNPESGTPTDAIEESEYNGKTVYLTFDDGPGENTQDILDILEEKNVKATFFVCYNADERYWPMYKRIVEGGHTIALHSYSHVYKTVYESLDSFKEDVTLIHDFVYEQTGVDAKIYRFPGGSSNTVSSVDMQELIGWLNEEGYTYYDWNALSGDAVNTVVASEELNENVLSYVRNNYGDSVVLMHDLGTLDNTVDGLSALIDTLKSEGYRLAPLDDGTTPVQHVKYKKDGQ